MALLDIQAMDTARDADKGCVGSDLSVLLCDSFASMVLC